MKDEYDFSDATRGKFYRQHAQVRLPIYLDAKLQFKLERLAQKNGREVGDIVEQMLQKEVGLLDELT